MSLPSSLDITKVIFFFTNRVHVLFTIYVSQLFAFASEILGLLIRLGHLQKNTYVFLYQKQILPALELKEGNIEIVKINGLGFDRYNIYIYIYISIYLSIYIERDIFIYIYNLYCYSYFPHIPVDILSKLKHRKYDRK